MGGGSDVSAPEPSEEERALQREQAQILREQRDLIAESQRVQNLLAPFLFESAGIEPVLQDITGQQAQLDTQISELQSQLQSIPPTIRQTTPGRTQTAFGQQFQSQPITTEVPNPERTAIQSQIRQLQSQRSSLDPNKIVGFNQIEDPNEALREEIETGFLERSRAALAGELPVNPALLRDLREQEETLRESIISQLGPGGQTSTPGIERLAKFEESRNVLLEGARRGDLTLAEQLGLSREQANQARIDSLIGRSTGINQASLPLTSAALGVAGGFSQPLSYLQNNRNMQLQAQQFNAEQGGGIGEIFGSVAGVAAGAFTGGFGAAAAAPAFAKIFE